MPPSDLKTRQLAGRILAGQLVCTLLLGMIFFLVSGNRSGLSALAGGLIGLIANLYMSFAALRPAPNAAFAVGRIYVGQLVKVLLTVGMFYVLSQRKGVVWPSVLVVYIATLMLFWLVPVLSARRQR